MIKLECKEFLDSDCSGKEKVELEVLERQFQYFERVVEKRLVQVRETLTWCFEVNSKYQGKITARVYRYYCLRPTHKAPEMMYKIRLGIKKEDIKVKTPLNPNVSKLVNIDQDYWHDFAVDTDMSGYHWHATEDGSIETVLGSGGWSSHGKSNPGMDERFEKNFSDFVIDITPENNPIPTLVTSYTKHSVTEYPDGSFSVART